MNDKKPPTTIVPFSALVAGDRYHFVDDEGGRVFDETFLVTDHAWRRGSRRSTGSDDHGLLSVSLASGATTWSSPEVLCARVQEKT